MNYTFLDIAKSLIPSSSTVYNLGKMTYDVGTLGIGIVAGLNIGLKVLNATDSKLAAIASGLFTTFAIVAITHPWTPIANLLVPSTIGFVIGGSMAATALAIGTLYLTFSIINKM